MGSVFLSHACFLASPTKGCGSAPLVLAGQPLPRPRVSFTHAKPSLTHQVLLALMRSGKLDYLGGWVGGGPCKGWQGGCACSIPWQASKNWLI